jgi:hypothetical protein
VTRVSIVGALRIADDSEVVAQRSPCCSHVRLQLQGVAQCIHRSFAFACCAQRETELVVRRCPLRLRVREGCQQQYRLPEVPTPTLSDGCEQRCNRMPGNDFQYLIRLSDRSGWIAVKQSLSVH